MIETLEITDAAVAVVFAHPRQRQLVLALIAKERSMSELSALSGTPLNLLHHHMRKFLRLGLVEITRRQRRAGAPIKFYRATARAFLVPAELSSDPPTDPKINRLRAALQRSRDRGVRGVIYSDNGRGASMRLVQDSQPGARGVEFWRELRLREADASELAKELNGVLSRFADRSGRGGRLYIVHAAMART